MVKSIKKVDLLVKRKINFSLQGGSFAATQCKNRVAHLAPHPCTSSAGGSAASSGEKKSLIQEKLYLIPDHWSWKPVNRKGPPCMLLVRSKLAHPSPSDLRASSFPPETDSFKKISNMATDRYHIWDQMLYKRWPSM